MKNKPLKTIFHINTDLYEKLYEQRFTSPYTQKIGIHTKPNTRGQLWEMFCCLTDTMMLSQERITELTINLERLTQPLPHIAINQFFTSCLREEIKATNDIEGIHSTRKEIDQAIEQQQNPEERVNTRLWAIVNKYQMLLTKENIAFSTCQDLRNFYDEFALDEVVKDDPKNKPDGIYFRSGHVAVSDGLKDIHKGLFPESTIIATMNKSLILLNNKDIPILLRISLYHYLFGYIHPFYDGNGRTSRFITSYYLSHNIHPLLGVRLSVTIKKAKRIYYKLFEDANDLLNRGELTYFVFGFMKIIEKALQETIDILSQKSDRFHSLQKELKNKDIKKSDRKIYYILLQASLFSDHSGATIKEIAKTLGQHENTVQRNLQRLQDETDYIIVHKGHRAYRYELNLDNFFR